ncbi:hypothetical protein N8540_00670 [Gammaproteobacteria bacterium]|nr:hypothetical protein [Gammaproteobacteria bacterium]MDB4164701.1 hypothetical protein [Gammaproteobacteria bacterium]MDC1358054.1 hypothetical protein [Gammaproteobacteria bacterium]MDC1422084.1 hypothetical protein [Gammaproteobacteria bacterium]MDC1426922.1 hypothetical protein [Gammaproteobacteria bacterium]
MNFDRIMQILGGLALLISLVFIAYELRISNRLAEMEALNRGYEGSSIIRSEMLTYADLWVKAVDGSPLSDTEEERIRLLCGGLVSNVNNNWAQDILGNVTNKVSLRLSSAESLGAGPCSFSRQSFVMRGEAHIPLLEAFDRGAGN